jgi:hypothetical protein
MAPLGVTFAAIRNGIPVLYNRRFTVVPNTPTLDIETEARVCPSSDCPNGYVGIFTGPDRRDAETFEKSHPGWWQGDLVGTARTYIQSQIDKHPEEVGPPINILRISVADGAMWIQQHEPCENIK